MTNLGHSIIGASFGVISLQPAQSNRSKIIHLAAFIALANLPDFPLPYWGHDLYYFSHSIFVNLLMISMVLLFLNRFTRMQRLPGKHHLYLLGAGAWLSHLLLDTFYNHGKGLLMFWPVTNARLALPIPWLSVMAQPLFPLTMGKIQVFQLELVTFSPFLLMAIWYYQKSIKLQG